MILSNLKNIFRLKINKLPRRELTVESTNVLRTTIESILTEMMKESCPCHYPRFRELAAFMHENFDAGPVFCTDTNYIVELSTRKELNFLTEINRIKNEIGFDDIIYCCNKCQTIYRKTTKQYSINFEFSFFKIEEAKYGESFGKEVTKPFPLLQGLYGFSDNDVKKCSNDFILGSISEVKEYMLEKFDKTKNYP